MLKLKHAGVAASVGVLAVGGITTIAVANPSHAPKRGHRLHHRQMARAADASSAPVAASQAFPALAQQHAASDDLTPTAQSLFAPAIAEQGLAASNSKLVASTSSEKVWAIAGASQVCVFAYGTETVAGCAPIASAMQKGIVLSGNNTVIAFLPSGTRDVQITHGDGSKAALAPNEGGALVDSSSAPFRELDYTSPDGNSQNLVNPHP